MSSLKEILEREQAPRKTPKDKRTVRLTKMGSFLRAYDWSAWILKRSGTSLKAGLDTSGDSYHLFVGFPTTSTDKFKPDGTEEIKTEDGTLEAWILGETQFPPEEEYSSLDEEYATWQKETTEKLISEKEVKKQNKKETEERQERTNRRETHVDDPVEQRSAQPLRLMDIAREILHFQLQEHSPEDCQRFIGRIQNEILQLL